MSRCSRMATCWKAAVILAGILILCSCRAVPPAELAVTENIISGGGPYTTADLPPSATTGLNAPCRTWSPPGIAGPWPKDEYICDGGDRDRPVKIDTDWTVKGLHLRRYGCPLRHTRRPNAGCPEQSCLCVCPPLWICEACAWGRWL